MWIRRCTEDRVENGAKVIGEGEGGESRREGGGRRRKRRIESSTAREPDDCAKTG